jgi:hypothetical protein
MTHYTETRLDTPEWAERHSEHGVTCKTCHCSYTDPYEFLEFFNFGTEHRVKVVGGIPDACKVCKKRAAEARRKALPINPALVAAVRVHAETNYENGWDVVVECYDDAAIWEVIAGAKTVKGATRRMSGVVSLRNERAAEIRATVW